MDFPRKSRFHRVIAPLTVLFVCLLLPSLAHAQAAVPCAHPLNEVDVIRLAAAGVPEARLVHIIGTCGVSFRVNRESEERLRAAGATKAVLAAIREKLVKPAAARPAPAPAAPEPTGENVPAATTESASKPSRAIDSGPRPHVIQLPVPGNAAGDTSRPAAANEGDKIAPPDLPRSYFERGQAFEEGQGVPQDYVQAAQWYRRAADMEPSELRKDA